MKPSLLRLLPAIVLPLALAAASDAATRYVSANLTTGTGDGTSWENAYRGPQGLYQAMAASLSGDQIWVAAGTYKASTSSRTVSHVIKAGVATYGGFAGGETSLDQRDFDANLCIVSGDLLGNDTSAASTRTDNSYHVLTATTGTTGVFDGFEVRAGYANSSANNDRGAGIICLASQSPTVRNCRFIDNRCTFGGGAGYVNGSAPKFIACDFEANQGGTYGGAFDCAGAGQVTFQDCTFKDNLAARAGALEFFQSQPRVTNCLFVGNRATGSGGGGAIWLGSSAAAVIRNVTVIGNFATVTSAGIYNTGGSSSVANSVVWGNTGPGTTADNGVRSVGGTTSVTYSCVQGITSGTGNIAVDPQVVNASAGDFRLQLNSPCVDVGSNAAVPAGVTVDLDGNPRVVEIPGVGGGTPKAPVVDMGAYETQLPPPPPCPADFDADGTVGPADLAALLGAWGTAACDLDGDGVTGPGDLASLLGSWGPCPG
jgi:hypothetical protein